MIAERLDIPHSRRRGKDIPRLAFALLVFGMPILSISGTSFAGDPVRATMETAAVASVGETVVPISLVHDGTQGIAGFLFQFCHDPLVVDPVSVSLSDTILTIDDGNLPAFSQTFVTDDGAFLSAVFTIQGIPTLIPPGTVTPIGQVNYVAVGASGAQTPIFSCNLISPPTNSYVVINTVQSEVSIEGELIVTSPFRRGDVNDDGAFDLADPIALGNYLFAGGDDSVCPRAGDANLDGVRDLADMVTLLQGLFGDGNPSSFGECTLDLASPLPCDSTGTCP